MPCDKTPQDGVQGDSLSTREIEAEERQQKMMEAEEMQNEGCWMGKWMSVKSPEDIQTNLKTGRFYEDLRESGKHQRDWVYRKERDVVDCHNK